MTIMLDTAVRPRPFSSWRFVATGLVDAALWYPALFAATGLFPTDAGFAASEWGWAGAASIAAATQIVSGLASGLYRGKRVPGSFEEGRLTTLSTVMAMFVIMIFEFAIVDAPLVTLGPVLAGASFQLLGALAVRSVARTRSDYRSRSRHERSQRILVFGAGEAGDQIVKALLKDTAIDLDPVAYLDDDPSKQRLVLHGVRVAGTRADIADVAMTLRATTILVALPSATQHEMNEIVDLAYAAGIGVKILPSVHSLTGSWVYVSDIRDMQMADFLNREEVQIDDNAIRSYIEGRRVLVSGAGGSVGSVLCRTILQYEPSELIMLDHDENALHTLQLDSEGRALLDDPNLVLCDIRDRDAVLALFDEHRPEVVFHAAAHKHVTFLERFPSEGVKTNIYGTLNVLSAAASVGVDRFVNISTDKAADPTSILGETKRTAERLTSHYDGIQQGRYLSVRFGNVLGSKGSVVPTFLEQLRTGAPMTVTDPEATRYFMTIEEAALLVLQAGAIGRGGDVLVLDMGEPVKIEDLARRLARQVTPGQSPQIVYTGLRPGEKLHEVLTSSAEEPLSSTHDRISRYEVPPLDPTRLQAEIGSVRS